MGVTYYSDCPQNESFISLAKEVQNWSAMKLKRN